MIRREQYQRLERHTQAVWLDVGYTASPNLTAQKVVFTKTR
jgi:hypothetical protein